MTDEANKEVSRRSFIVGAGALVAGGAVGGVVGSQLFAKEKVIESIVPVDKIVEKTVEKQVPMTFAASTGYLVHDSTKCAFCMTCMMACSLAHEGKENASVSRIQIDANALGRYPDDLQMYVCRQCKTPVCVQNCPTGACHVDSANGNVRVIDESKCIGCMTCIDSCPQQPHRTVWNSETKKATKCDLCLNTPYWGEKGGPDGKQACVELCPMNALKLVKEMPSQRENTGYEVNLRSKNYEGLVTKSAGSRWWETL